MTEPQEDKQPEIELPEIPKPELDPFDIKMTAEISKLGRPYQGKAGGGLGERAAIFNPEEEPET